MFFIGYQIINKAPVGLQKPGFSVRKLRTGFVNWCNLFFLVNTYQVFVANKYISIF